jgi:hypothetical protein
MGNAMQCSKLIFVSFPLKHLERHQAKTRQAPLRIYNLVSQKNQLAAQATYVAPAMNNSVVLALLR